MYDDDALGPVCGVPAGDKPFVFWSTPQAATTGSSGLLFASLHAAGKPRFSPLMVTTLCAAT
jgi:hypothetical protein